MEKGVVWAGRDEFVGCMKWRHGDGVLGCPRERTGGRAGTGSCGQPVMSHRVPQRGQREGAAGRGGLTVLDGTRGAARRDLQ